MILEVMEIYRIVDKKKVYVRKRKNKTNFLLKKVF